MAVTALAQPTVSNVTANQQAGTRQVAIGYTLSHPQSLPCLVTLQASRDNGATWETVASVTGALGAGITSTPGGASKSITWNAGNDWPAQIFPQVKIRITADDGQGSGVAPAGMLLIPAGTFMMGDSKNEGESDERPAHSVTVSAFYLQQTEVTYAQWKEIWDWNASGSRGYDFTAGQRGATSTGSTLADSAANNTHPVTMVTWWDVVKWCNAKSRKEGLTPCYYTDAVFSAELKSGTLAIYANWSASGYRLPTEAEWEYAARGRLAGQSYPWGDGIAGSQANYLSSGDPFGGTTPAGYYDGSQMPAGIDMKNGYGIYDMAGNVWEWNWDWYGAYSSSAQTDPRGPASGSVRTGGGAGWGHPAASHRCADRNYAAPDYRYGDLGFRPARSFAATSSLGSSVFSLDLRNVSVPVVAAISAPRQVVNLGQSLALSVVATSSTTASYQWNRNGLPISGATAATYTITNATPLRDGGWYQTVVTNSSGATTSAVVFVNVAVSPAQVVAWGFNAEGQTTVPSGLNNVVALAAGDNHSVALRGDGTVVAWGKNNFGQTTVPVGLNNVVGICAGHNHTLALKADTTVVAWGLNDNGQVTVPAGLSNVVGLAGGGIHTVALKADGTVVAWGGNTDGQATVPAGLTNVIGIAAGYYHTAALKGNGTVAAWGRNDRGQTTIPPGLSNVVSVSAGGGDIVALKADGTVVAWGENRNGETAVPTNLNTVVCAAAGQHFTVTLKADGTVVAWGENNVGQTTVPGGLDRILGLAAGVNHSLAVREAFSAPSIATHPQGQTASLGSSVTFTVVASGAAPLAYQWRKDGVAITGATNASYTLGNTQTLDGGIYTVTVSNSAGSVTSNAAPLLVVTLTVPPTITTQPTNQSVTTGGTATFAVVATGTAPLAYQWRRDGAAITGATAATLTLANAQSSTAGVYTVVVSNGAGSTTSTGASLTVTAVGIGPAIIEHPAGQTVGVGTNVTLHVGVSGSSPFTYQWRRNGATLTGATSDTLILPTVAQTSAGSYTVVVANAYGTATSNPAVLEVILAPTITTQPLNQSAAVGGNLAFSVAANGAPPLTYQWSKDGRALAGATNATLALNAVGNADAGNYAVVVANGAGSVTSRPATLVVSEESSRLANLSMRTTAGTGTQTLIVGFVVAGTGASKPVLLRAIGPSLAAFGVTGALADPQLALFSGTIQLAVNDHWGDSLLYQQIADTGRRLGAFTLDARSRDAALYAGLQPESYTAQVVAAGASGVALLELYDGDPSLPSKLVNVSARCQVGTGASILIAGLVIQGNTSKTLLLRAVGPTLVAFGVGEVLADPQLVLFRGADVLATNDDWWRGSGAQNLPSVFATVGAFLLAPQSRDAALLISLPPGQYTAQVSGAEGGTGVALIEVYEVP